MKRDPKYTADSIHKIKNPLTKVVHHKLKDKQSSFELFYCNLYFQPHTDKVEMEDL